MLRRIRRHIEHEGADIISDLSNGLHNKAYLLIILCRELKIRFVGTS